MASGVAFFEAVKSGELDTSMELVDTATIDFGIQERMGSDRLLFIHYQTIVINNIIVIVIGSRRSSSHSNSTRSRSNNNNNNDE